MAKRDLLALEDRVALVSGAGRGIGRACAVRLGEAGARVCALDLDGPSAAAVAEEIRAQDGQALGLEVDVCDAPAFEAALERCSRELGELSVCVNNAGGMAGHALGPFLEASPEFLDDAVELNLKAVFRCCQAEARRMLAQGTGGSIINVSSLGGVRAVRGVTAYGAAKAGVINLTQTMAVELGPHGIRSNAIAPGTTVTAAITEQVERRLAPVAEANPLGRVAQPEDMADVVLFLASDLSRYVNGQLICVDGGFTASVGVLPRRRKPA